MAQCDYYTCNAGFCSIEEGQIKCSCLTGFEGDRCETKIDRCANSNCETGESKNEHSRENSVENFFCALPLNHEKL